MNNTISRISWLAVTLALTLSAISVSRSNAADPQVVGGVDVSQWRGFNLLEKFTLSRNAPFVENDFRWIAELGFNYVRLPMDYRCYVEKDDWLKFKEDQLKEIDQAIEFGRKYRVHVSINLHRAPGFCINPPAEPTDLWTDDQTLEVFAAHWAMFAKRYRGMPSKQLSFNLLNEPARTSKENYLKVFRRAIEAIHAVDPDRLILVDGMNVGRDPVSEFVAMPNVVQSTRGYHPGGISHYRASWVKGSDTWAEPVWPPAKVNGYLYGPTKAEFKSALTIKGDLPAGTEVSLRVDQLSVKARVAAKVDGQMVLDQTCDPKADPALWKLVETSQPYKPWQPAKPMNLTLTLKTAAREMVFENVDGDWLKFSELAIRLPNGTRRSYATDQSWGKKQGTFQVAAGGQLLPPPGTAPDQTLIDYLKPWKEISAAGEAVFVGEWGCYNKTPHPVALAWMKSWLEQWKQARFGWALWNFRGSFGILDSGRSDVQYEDWNGHKLDREMLDLLQQYLKY